MEVVQIEETDADEQVHQTLCLVSGGEFIAQVEDNEEGRQWLENNFWHMLDSVSRTLLNGYDL